jgi:predicted RND superfamily exporter protein
MRKVRSIGAWLVVIAGVIYTVYLELFVIAAGCLFNIIEGVKANPTDARQILWGLAHIPAFFVVPWLCVIVIGVLASLVAPSDSAAKSTSKKFLPWKRKRS